ncbi:hypothetical protein H5T87_07820 [bacterium]|nr:hypothetical protein [bacterium]
MKFHKLVFINLFLFLASTPLLAQSDLENGFRNPPDWAKPWVYWFWLNGYITKEGISADLEAMRRAGIGGVLIMEVDQGTPPGPVSFASEEWMKLFQWVVKEASRLGLKVNMNNDAGWTGSGGPWIPPQFAMQKLTWSKITVEGPSQIELQLPSPPTNLHFYRDIAVIAIPHSEPHPLLPSWDIKAVFRDAYQPLSMPAHYSELPEIRVIPLAQIHDISSQLNPQGKLVWNVPDGKWDIIRFGYTPTGAQNAPSPLSGRGLECDKLSKEAVEFHFNSFVKKLIENVGNYAGKTLVATHIDSWEVGLQNWTPRMREEFRLRRGYDLLPFLPALIGEIVESREITERFLWDFRKTISELVLENYAGTMRKLANKYGLRLTIEGYSTSLTDEFAYGGQADEPMGEFWSWGKFGASSTCTEMASAGHTHGKRVIGAEAFTADSNERWLGHPGNIKDLADWAFTEGINRFVVHRYALQPWLNVKPGMSMGPWGLHYERTQTWWESSKAWHTYLSRCQYLLQQGLFVADICMLVPERAPQSLGGQPILSKSTAPGRPFERPGYNFDFCSSDALYQMKVKDGRLTLPDGMSYRVLVLPRFPRMTPKLLKKLEELIRDGATVIGAPPHSSPSLEDYPNCDIEIQKLAKKIWGTLVTPEGIRERKYGKGRIFWGGHFSLPQGSDLSQIMETARWIWYPEGNPLMAVPQNITRFFKREFFTKDNTQIKSAQLVITADNQFKCLINGHLVGQGDNWEKLYSFDVKQFLKPGMNEIFIIARNGGDIPNPAGVICALVITYADNSSQYIATDNNWQSSISEDSKEWLPALELGYYGIGPWGNATIGPVYYDIEEVCKILKKLGIPPDFSYEPPKTPGTIRYIHRSLPKAEIYFIANQESTPQDITCFFRIKGRLPELWFPETGKILRPPSKSYKEMKDGTMVFLHLEPLESLFVVFPKNKSKKQWLTLKTYERYSIQKEIEIDGEWEVRFPPHWGAPEKVILPRLISWSEHPNEGIRFFSGTAIYIKKFYLPREIFGSGRRYFLDLGEVMVMADVMVNDSYLGTLWKKPYRVDITSAVKPGENKLLLKVTNLWVNRMIGDEHLPEDSERNPDGTLRSWPSWLLEGKPSPTGRFTFTTWRLWGKDDPLQPSGLIGPVRIQIAQEKK